MKKGSCILFSCLFILGKAYAQSPTPPDVKETFEQRISNNDKGKIRLYYNEKAVRFGFYIGPSTVGYGIENKSIFDNDSSYHFTPSGWWGISFGAVNTIRLLKHFDLRLMPGFSFNPYKFAYDLYVYPNGVIGTKMHFEKRVYPLYFDLPATLNFNFLTGPFTGYLIAGGRYVVNLSRLPNIGIETYRHNLLLEFGLGGTVHLKHFVVSLEFNVGFGFRDVIIRDNTLLNLSIKSAGFSTSQFNLIVEK